MSEYIAYITRDDVEYEVSAELYDEGYGCHDSWEDTGPYFEIEKDPIFHKFYTEDDNGNEVVLTSEEVDQARRQMINYYWENNNV
jgi:hypothetical protein